MGWFNKLLVSDSTGTKIHFLPKIPNAENDQVHLIKKDEHYLRLRAKAINLDHDRILWTKYSPLLTVEIKGIFSEGLQSLIRVVGKANDLGEGKKNVPAVVHDVLLLDYLPYRGGDIEASIQLYRVATDNVARKMFDSLDRVTQTIGGGLLGDYLPIGKVVTEELAMLLSGGTFERILSIKQGIHNNRIQPGYLIYTDVPTQKIEEYLKSFDADFPESLINMAFQQNRPEWEYCVLEIESHDSRDDINALNFHIQWEQEVLPLIWEGDIKRAKRQMSNIFREIRLSPLLTLNDRKAMPLVYRVDFDKEVEEWQTFNENTGNDNQYRAAGSGEAYIPPPASAALTDVALKSGIAIEPFSKLSEGIASYPQSHHQKNSFQRTNMTKKLDYVKNSIGASSANISLEDICSIVEESML
jgi:hypothetical protein